MQEDSLNSDLESLKRTVCQAKSILEQIRTLLLDTLFRIEEIAKIAEETGKRASTVSEKLRENPNDAGAQQDLEQCHALIKLLGESLSQHMVERDDQLAEISTITNTIKVAERMIIEFSTEPGAAGH